MFGFLFLVGCVSLEDKARLHMQNESYSQAIEVYRQILESNANNAKAQIGLRKARIGWIGQQLINVRLMRLAGNLEKSHSLLLEVIEKENQWGHFPKGAVAFTQKEEAQVAQKRVKLEIQQALTVNRPLRAQFLIDKYESFFQGKKEKRSIQQLMEDTKILGNQQCQRMAQELADSQFYFGNFVRKICQVWSYHKPSLKRQVRFLRGELYGSIDLNSENLLLSRDQLERLQKNLTERLRQSPWFQAGSKKKLSLDFLGYVSYDHSSHQDKLKHAYTVSIPYQESHVQSVPSKNTLSAAVGAVQGVFALLDLVGAIAGGESFQPSTYSVANGDGTRTVYETKFRQEIREARYLATIHEESFVSDLELTGKIGAGSLKVEQKSRFRNSTVEHHNDMPDIGLRPERPKIIGEEVWTESQFDKLVLNFEGRLKEAWDQLYCGSEERNSGDLDSVEAMFRCIHVRSDGPPLAFDKWFHENMGLSFKETHQVVGSL
ncbi:MAG: hypothetical protein KDD33_03485 [Bdellovibrionales bacterium]|nr:hypothetical protein [Bdellovibrionales bacterium]